MFDKRLLPKRAGDLAIVLIIFLIGLSITYNLRLDLCHESDALNVIGGLVASKNSDFLIEKSYRYNSMVGVYKTLQMLQFIEIDMTLLYSSSTFILELSS